MSRPGPGRSRSDGVTAASPTVSVILATNRASPFLAEALASVSHQSYQPIELIVVDDGSVDTKSLDDAVAGIPMVRVMRQDAAGVAIARNNGAATATGDLLVFLDDDDRWHRDRLERQVEAFAANPSAVVGYCGMQSIDRAGNVIAPADQIAVASVADIARRVTGIILPNMMIRRGAFETVRGFDGNLRLAEDLDLVLKLAQVGEFVFSPDVLVEYRSHPANATKSYRALCAAIDQVVRSHLGDATVARDRTLGTALRESLRSNNRFAWWAAARNARAALGERHVGAAVSDVVWALRFAPLGPADATLRRLRRSR